MISDFGNAGRGLPFEVTVVILILTAWSWWILKNSNVTEMPTVRWEPRESSPHFFYQSLERFLMVKSLGDIHMFMLFLVMESVERKRRPAGGYLSFCMTALTMLSIEFDLHRLRPSNFYPRDGFYPEEAYDAYE